MAHISLSDAHHWLGTGHGRDLGRDAGRDEIERDKPIRDEHSDLF